MRNPTPEENEQYIRDCMSLWRMFFGEMSKIPHGVEWIHTHQMYWTTYNTLWFYLVVKDVPTQHAIWILMDSQMRAETDWQQSRDKK